MVKPLLLLPAVIILACVSTSYGQKPAHKAAAEAEPAHPATIQVEPPRPAVKQIYKVDCAICHGDTGDGKGDIGKTMNLNDWTNGAGLSGKTDEQLAEFIRKGNDKMPGEDASRAKDDEIKGLVKYIRSFSANHAAPAETPTAAPAATPAPTPNPSPTSN
ncbi:MAG TPA: cytochrome c [Terracidiphilus sp.]|nr:cytochrome c [Terracidiphilus sp.]